MMTDLHTSCATGEAIPPVNGHNTTDRSPRFHVLFDIDGTLTDDLDAPQIDNRYALGNALIEIFCDFLREGGMDRCAAERVLVEYAEQNIYWDYPDFIHHFGFPTEDAWQRLRSWHAKHIRVYQDGVQLVRRLHNHGYALHIVSNNPLSGCLLKLEVAGLGGLQGTPWFSRIFCSNIHRGQKGSPAFWERAIISAGITPSQAIVIGNDFAEDFKVPDGIGVRQHYIVDRNGILTQSSERPWIVKNLALVEAHLIESCQTQSTPCD